MDNVCINCVNCVIYDKKYSCDYNYWSDKKINDIFLFIPQMFDCEEYEEYNGDNPHLKND